MPPWKVVHVLPNGGEVREFVGKPTPQEEREFYDKFSGVKAAPLPREIARHRKGQKSK